MRKRRYQISAPERLKSLPRKLAHAIQKVSLHPRDSKTIILILNRNHTRPERAPHNTNFLYTLSYLAHARGELLEHSPLSIHHDQKGWPVIPPPFLYIFSLASPYFSAYHSCLYFIQYIFFLLLVVRQSIPSPRVIPEGSSHPQCSTLWPLCRRPPQLLGIWI